MESLKITFTMLWFQSSDQDHKRKNFTLRHLGENVDLVSHELRPKLKKLIQKIIENGRNSKTIQCIRIV